MSVAHDRSVSQDDPRVIRALEEYLAALEAGQSIVRDDLLSRHADIADVLGKCLDGLEFIHAAAPDVGQASSLSLLGQISNPPSDASGAAALGDYRLLRELGRGGMGVVYEAAAAFAQSPRRAEGPARSPPCWIREPCSASRTRPRPRLRSIIRTSSMSMASAASAASTSTPCG